MLRRFRLNGAVGPPKIPRSSDSAASHVQAGAPVPVGELVGGITSHALMRDQFLAWVRLVGHRAQSSR